MCVSAEASFVLAGILVPVGIYCIRTAAKRERSAILIAVIPVLFGIQQFCEGLVWLGLAGGNAPMTHIAGLCYLFFALAFWLFWIPFSAMFLERRQKFRLIYALDASVGLLSGLVLIVPVFMNPETLEITIMHHSLLYDYPATSARLLAPQFIWQFLYVTVISLPLILTRNKQLIGFSTALVVSALISHLYYYYAFESIWCFFAAFLSLYLAYSFHSWPVLSATCDVVPETTIN